MIQPPKPQPAETRDPFSAKSRRRLSDRVFRATVFIILVTGLTLFTYPSAAQYTTALNQTQVTKSYSELIGSAKPPAESQISAAHRYNEALKTGLLTEARLNPGERKASVAAVPAPTDVLPYEQQLKAENGGLMARIKIAKIDVDLPVYHGTSDATLNIGAGHLQGTSLPVGGKGTHSVITAHRGMASARMFTDLDKVAVGDTFVVDTFGEILTYKVKRIKVVEPEDSETIKVEPDQDLMTLVTCTPLGINSHRILVTGVRITPTPLGDIALAKQPTDPGFPWWLLWYVPGVVACWFVARWAVQTKKPQAESQGDSQSQVALTGD